MSIFFYSNGDHRDLHSFPTRRSSDLNRRQPVGDHERRAAAAQRAQAVLNLRLALAVETRRRFVEDQNRDRKSTRLNSSHSQISYAVFCLKKKTAACPAS